MTFRSVKKLDTEFCPDLSHERAGFLVASDHPRIAITVNHNQGITKDNQNLLTESYSGKEMLYIAVNGGSSSVRR